MPPRVKKPAGTPGPRRPPRSATKGAGSKAEAESSAPDTQPEPVSVEDEVKAEVVAKDDPDVDSHANIADLNVKPSEDPKSGDNDMVPVKKEEEDKEPVDEVDGGERLDLEDNEPEYEPEEYGIVDDDEKEMDQQDVLEEENEVIEEVEEEEVDVVEEDIEEDEEEVEGEENGEHTGGVEPADSDDAVEVEEHHDIVKERRKRKEFEVFVGGLDKDATEEDLKKVFSAVGKVNEVRLMKNPQTKKNKGFAFLRFATVEQAKRAVTELRNPVVNGKQCGVTASQDSDTLFLGNINKTWTKEALEKKLKHYGIENIEDLTLVEDSNNPGMNRGFAFLEFSSRSDSMDAFKRLQKRDVVFGVDKPAKVSFADSFIDPGDEIMAQVKTVFMDGIPASWDEDHVKELVKKYGQVDKIELARNMPSARRKDFGFVTFETHDAAINCAKGINNTDLGEGDRQVRVRARLSRPLQRGKGKHATRTRHAPRRGPKAPWNRPLPRPLPSRSARRLGSRMPPPPERRLKKPSGLRDRRAAPPPLPSRPRPLPLPPPPPRSYDRRAPVPAYPKASLRRDYPRREENYPRSRPVADHSSRLAVERRTSYREDYSTRGLSDLSRSASARAAPRRVYPEDSYGPRYERPPPSYRDSRARDFDSVSGSKRPYSAMDEVPSRYADAGARHSRPRLDYDIPGGSSHYGDAYSDRLGRSSIGYGGSRSSMSSHDSHGLYGGRQTMSYGSYNGGDAGSVYSSSYSSDYVSRGSDVGGSSYSTMYPSRGIGGSGYMGSSGSGSYY